MLKSSSIFLLWVFHFLVCNPIPTIPGEWAQNIFKQLCPPSYFSALYCLLVACVEKTQRLEAVQNLLDCCCRVTFGQLPCTQPSHYPPHCVHIHLGTGHPPCRQAYSLLKCTHRNRFSQCTHFTFGFSTLCLGLV